MNDTPIAPLISIAIIDGVRVGYVKTPDGETNQHGLGVVGEPLKPYLGHRAEGYRIVITKSPVDIPVTQVTNGRKRRLTWKAVGAPDVDQFTRPTEWARS